jgi:hypothetical protein
LLKCGGTHVKQPGLSNLSSLTSRKALSAVEGVQPRCLLKLAEQASLGKDARSVKYSDSDRPHSPTGKDAVTLSPIEKGLLACVDALLEMLLRQGATPAELGLLFAARLDHQHSTGNSGACAPLRMMANRCAQTARAVDAAAAALPAMAPTSAKIH